MARRATIGTMTMAAAMGTQVLKVLLTPEAAPLAIDPMP
jgi:hypothetical protein